MISNSSPPGDVPQSCGRIDVLTVAAIGVLAYFVGALLHEGGHALTGVAFGVHKLKLTSFDVEFDHSLLTALQRRVVSAAGILCNFITGSLLLFLARKLRGNVNLRYFIWLLGHISLFGGGGYLMALSFVSFGDMNNLLRGLPHELPLRIGATVLGALIMTFTLIHGAYWLNPFLGLDAKARPKRALLLSIVPYLAGCLVDTFAAVFAGAGVFLVVCSAAAGSFGGTSWMLMMVFPIDGGRRLASEPPLTPARSALWIGLGVAATILNFGVFGQGVHIAF
jgi:hypothetical protein